MKHVTIELDDMDDFLLGRAAAKAGVSKEDFCRKIVGDCLSVGDFLNSLTATSEDGGDAKAREFAIIGEDELMDKMRPVTEENLHNVICAVRDDLKVGFDTENICWTSEGDAELLGIHTLGNGLTFFGLAAGGDWESPVFMIVYWDGSSLRGYVPTDGNPWNTDTSQAYGNDDNKDIANARKRYPEDEWKDWMDLDGEFCFEWDKVRADIERAICNKVLGKAISRSEALRTARQILDRAELERIELAEQAAKRGFDKIDLEG